MADLPQLSPADAQAALALQGGGQSASSPQSSDLPALSPEEARAALALQGGSGSGQSSGSSSPSWASQNLPHSLPQAASMGLQGVQWAGNGIANLAGNASDTALELMQDPSGTIKNLYQGARAEIQNPISKLQTYAKSFPLPAGVAESNQGLFSSLNNVQPYTPQNPNDPATKTGGNAIMLAGYNPLDKAASSLAIKYGPEVLGVARGLIGRTALASGVGVAQGGNPISGAVANLVGEGVGKGMDIAGNPAQSLVNLAAKRAMNDSSAVTASGARVHPEVKTPAEVQQTLDALPPGIPTTFGSVTGSPIAVQAEHTLNALPGNKLYTNAKTGVAEANQMSNQALQGLMGGTKPEDINTNLHSALQATPIGQKIAFNQGQTNNLVNNMMGESTNSSLIGDVEDATAKQKAADYAAMQAKYKPIDDYAAQSGFNATQRPALQDVYKKYSDQYNTKVSQNLVDPQSEVGKQSQRDLAELATISSTPKNNVQVPLQSLMQASSDFKDRARQAGQYGDTARQKMYNDVGQAFQNDYTNNAQRLDIPSIEDTVKDAHSFAKNNYFDRWNRNDLDNVVNGKSSSVIGTLTSNKNKDVLQSFPQDLKNKIFMASLGDRLKTDSMGNPAVDQEDLARYTSQGGASNAQKSSNLLDDDTQQRINAIVSNHNDVKGYKDLVTSPNSDYVKELSNSKNMELTDQLPQEAKHLLYAGQLKNKIHSGENLSITADNLMKHFEDGSSKQEGLNEHLLSPEMKQQLQNVAQAAKVTKSARQNLPNVNDVSKLQRGIGFLRDAKILFGLHPVAGAMFAGGLFGGNKLTANRLSNPHAMQNYAKGQVPFPVGWDLRKNTQPWGGIARKSVPIGLFNQNNN